MQTAPSSELRRQPGRLRGAQQRIYTHGCSMGGPQTGGWFRGKGMGQSKNAFTDSNKLNIGDTETRPDDYRRSHGCDGDELPLAAFFPTLIVATSLVCIGTKPLR